MIVAHENRVTPWRAFGGASATAVRIWIRRTPFGFFQRHEWRRPDDSEWREAWIPSLWRDWPASAAPVAAHDPADVMREALGKIAAGHNDARRLAADALALATG